DTAPTLYYRWMYRTIQGAMEDEFKRASDSTDVNPFESWHKTIVSENSFPRLLANLDAPWWDDVSTDVTETAQDIVGLALTRATADLTAELGNAPHHWQYNKLHTVTHKHAMSDVPVLGDWLNVGPFGLGAAKDALCKYEFKLKEAVDYSVFSGPSMRIGIDFNDIDAAESILPTGQSGNPFSDFYDNQAPLYHTGQFRKMRMNPSDIIAHASSTATIAP
ncbi:penicillin acylase family protein, partial [Flavobacteriales bacterium]|nr:penicillin acylase family protein [Flavobacteriales bacterium]